ncbi:MAG: hypothetical protein JWR07_5459 [Nevskia sp.]|nr:hypothetical protein [Nevskia sp.]
MSVARLSAWVAIACKSPDFWRFLQVSGEQESIEQVRARCAVASRAEFDNDPAAAARLHQLIRIPFIDFPHHQEHDDEF